MARKTRYDIKLEDLGSTCPHCQAFIHPRDIRRLGGGEAVCPHCGKTYSEALAPGWSQLGS